MSGGEDTTDERIGVYNLVPSQANGYHVNLMPSCHVDQPQAGDSDRSQLTEHQSVIIDDTSTTSENSNQDVDTSLDKEPLAKAREEAFRALSSEERKAIITMQDLAEGNTHRHAFSSRHGM